ncbi:type II RES/Xre toxin-antitoxin system antitoxin [Mucilaginibacter terrae]|uniref:Toxin-antitoxin system antitoxin component (TIGR02293 family) n=1 Tax=Mucilaginibacter terrae TaxID=1955052 RepID=A0ABU3GZK2_9SPHI|nr:antitoxin Xre/MbcA/ParS toxin-binding domain-containing protein [Mucilaginibacter terrae]MDT3405181.1 putative toxin-antitoxin system antitoxin component (TIGR02293 family) [Mucilaginibacter terrae]
MSYSKKHIDQNEVHEPMAAYITTDSVTSFYNLLTGVNPGKASSDFDVVRLARQGLPKKVLTTLAQKISLTLQELAGIMHINERTLQRYDDDTVVKTEYAEKAVELARLYTRGEEVFGSMDKFKRWMKTPSHIFKGESPVSLLDTSIGFDLVLRELGRIEHGIFA